MHELLETLRKLTLEKAVANITVGDVAERAGVSHQDVIERLGPAHHFAAVLSFHEAKEAPIDTRVRILESAGRVFARKGLQKATLDEVAADAGVTKGAIYWHFKNKNDLFFSLLDYRFDQHEGPIRGNLEQVLSAAKNNPLKALSDSFTQNLQRVTDDPEWIGLFVESLAQARDPAVRARFSGIYERGWDISEDITRVFIEQGIMREGIDTKSQAVFWNVLFDGLTLAWYINRDTLDVQPLIESFFETLWHGIKPTAQGKEEKQK